MQVNKTIFNYSIAFVATFLFQLNGSAQQRNPFSFSNDTSDKDVIMTWNKNTPEEEMKEDIKALKEKDVTIKYSDLKRNSKKEITAIKVEYSDRKGNKGCLEYNNQKPINTIQFFKQGDEIGFGEPAGSNDFFAGNDFFNNLQNGKDIIKQFQFGNDKNNSQSFSFSFPNGEDSNQSKSKIMIQKDGKKPLVIEDGVVVEGGDDYSEEEIEKIKKENKVESFGFKNDGENKFDLRNQDGLENFKKQMEKMQLEFGKTNSDKTQSESSSDDIDKTKEEMIKAKEEMIKATKELEEAKKELQKAKTTLKTQKS